MDANLAFGPQSNRCPRGVIASTQQRHRGVSHKKELYDADGRAARCDVPLGGLTRGVTERRCQSGASSQWLAMASSPTTLEAHFQARANTNASVKASAAVPVHLSNRSSAVTGTEARVRTAPGLRSDRRQSARLERRVGWGAEKHSFVVASPFHAACRHHRGSVRWHHP